MPDHRQTLETTPRAHSLGIETGKADWPIGEGRSRVVENLVKENSREGRGTFNRRLEYEGGARATQPSWGKNLGWDISRHAEVGQVVELEHRQDSRAWGLEKQLLLIALDE